MDYLGYRPVSSTIDIYFTTHAQTGAAVAPNSAFEAADVKLYKDGSATERSSTSGWTMTSPFDSIVGLHKLTIDLSDNTDAGFYAAGSRYTAVLSPDETVDGLAVVRVLASFDIGVPPANVTQFGGTNATTSGGRPEVNTTHAAGTAWGSGAITAGAIASDAITAAKLASDVATEINSAVLAVLGALNDSAADGDPTNSDTIVQYLKQLVNVLMGTAGIVSFPSSATPGNAVSLAEVIRQIYDEVAGLNGGSLVDSAAVQAAAEAALVAKDLDHLLNQPYDASSPPGSQTSLFNRLVEPDNGSPQQPRFTATALEEAPTGGGASAATIADAVWDEDLSGHTGSGSSGQRLGRIPNVAAAANGGLPTVDGSNRIAGIQGTLNTLDDLDTAQDSQHSTTQSRIGTPSNLGGGASLAQNLADIEAQTDDIGTAGAGLTAIPWNASWDAEVESEVADALEATIADSVPADGSRPSVKQALYMLAQFMTERSVSGTTVTVKKPDGSTTLFTLTLNDATSPTSTTRAS